MRSGQLLSFATAAVMMGPAPARAGIGLEVMLRPGYGSAGDQSPVRYEPAAGLQEPDVGVGSVWRGTAKPYGGGFVLDGSVGYRPLSFVSMGLTGGWRMSGVSSSASSDFSNLSRSALQVGFYGRGYLPLVGTLTGFDPWVSVGATYVYDKQTYSQNVTMPVSVSLTHQGVGIPLAVGIDYGILPLLSVGPSFQYEIVTAAGACMTPSQANLSLPHQCSDADSSIRMTAAKNYMVWSIGLELRLSL